MNQILQPHEKAAEKHHKIALAKDKKAKPPHPSKKGNPAKIKVTAPLLVVVTAENKCGLCSASKCCRYVTRQIDAPRSLHDFDTLLWEVSHHNVEVFKDEDGWFLMFIESPCHHLQTDGGCGIYSERPQICRDHSNETCEYDQSAEEGFELYFPDYDTLQKYCKKRFKKWDQRFKKFAKE